jgi:hypothetical protein
VNVKSQDTEDTKDTEEEQEQIIKPPSTPRETIIIGGYPITPGVRSNVFVWISFVSSVSRLLRFFLPGADGFLYNDAGCQGFTIR